MQQVDDPPSLPVGTEVSAKYKGAFCEAKVSKVVRNIKVKVAYKHGLGSGIVSDEVIKPTLGQLRVGGVVEVRHPDRKEPVEATVTKIQDCSQYTVVFDDGDITTLRRTALCLKSGRHFNESETLDQLPLTHPEHFGNPVVGGRRGRRRGQLNEDSSEEEEESDAKEIVNEKEEHIGKVVCVEVESKKKDKEKFFPGLVVAPTAQATVRIRVKDDYLVRSFKDGRYYTVPKKEATEFTRESAAKQDSAAVQAALEFLDNNVLPPHWDREVLFGLRNSSSDDDGEIDSDSSDDEPREEKDRFVAQLYKYMDDRGTPLNKVPTIQNRDVDLYRLFRAVQKRGGYNRVTSQNQWKSVALRLGFSPITASVANLVKQSYKKFLQPYGDFNRKLGCSMLMTPRNSSRSKGRSLVRAISVASPKPSLETTKEPITKPNQMVTATVAPSTPTTICSPLAIPIAVTKSVITTAAAPAQSGNDESECTSESSQDLSKNRRKVNTLAANNGGKVKSLVEKYEEKAALASSAIITSNIKDEKDLPLSKIKAAEIANAIRALEEKEAKEKEKEHSVKEASVSSKDSVRIDSTSDTRDPSPTGSVASTTTTSGKRERIQKKQIVQNEEKRNKRRKEVSVEKVDVGDFRVEVGDKLKVYYHEKKVTYEAKVIEITLQQGIPMYMVHYTGWNNRYDEWVPRERIAENLSKNARLKKSAAGSTGSQSDKNKENPPKPPSAAALSAALASGAAVQANVNLAPNSGNSSSTSRNASVSTAARRGRGRSESGRTRSATPSSMASNSSRNKSLTATASKHRRPKRNGARRISITVSDVSLPTESETDSDEPVRPRATRANKEVIYKSIAAASNKLSSVSNIKTTTTSVANSPSETGDDADDDDDESASNTNKFRSTTGTSVSAKAQAGRDYDLNQIRSELKGFQELKSPSPVVSEESTNKIKNEQLEFDFKPITPSVGTTVKTELKQEKKEETTKSTTDLSSETDSYADDDSQSSDRTTKLQNMTKKLQRKINTQKKRVLTKPLHSGTSKSSLEQDAALTSTRIVEKTLKDTLAEKRHESFKNKSVMISENRAIKKEIDSQSQTVKVLNAEDDKKIAVPTVITATNSKYSSLIVEKNFMPNKKAEVKNQTMVKKSTEISETLPIQLRKDFLKATTCAAASPTSSTSSTSSHLSTISTRSISDISKLDISSASSSSSFKDVKFSAISTTSTVAAATITTAASIKKSNSPDIYEFKDNEPFEFEIRKSPLVSVTGANNSTHSITSYTACSGLAGNLGYGAPILARRQSYKPSVTIAATVSDHTAVITAANITPVTTATITNFMSTLHNRKKRGSPHKDLIIEKLKQPNLADMKLSMPMTITTNTCAKTTNKMSTQIPSAVVFSNVTSTQAAAVTITTTATMTMTTQKPILTVSTIAPVTSSNAFDALRKSPSFNLINALNEELAQTVQETTRALIEVSIPAPPSTPPVIETTPTKVPVTDLLVESNNATNATQKENLEQVPTKISTPKQTTCSSQVTVGSPFIETRKDVSNVFEMYSSDASNSNIELRDTKFGLEKAKILLSATVCGGFDLEPVPLPEHKPLSIADKVLKAISQKKEEEQKGKEIETTEPMCETSKSSNLLLKTPLEVPGAPPSSSLATLCKKNLSLTFAGLIPVTSGAPLPSLLPSKVVTSLPSPETKLKILEANAAKNAHLNETIQKLECAIQRKACHGLTPTIIESPKTVLPTSTTSTANFSEDSIDSTDSERKLIIEDVNDESVDTQKSAVVVQQTQQKQPQPTAVKNSDNKPIDITNIKEGTTLICRDTISTPYESNSPKTITDAKKILNQTVPVVLPEVPAAIAVVPSNSNAYGSATGINEITNVKPATPLLMTSSTNVSNMYPHILSPYGISSSGFFLDPRTELRPEDGVKPITDILPGSTLCEMEQNKGERENTVIIGSNTVSSTDAHHESINLLCEETIPGSPAPITGKDDSPLVVLQPQVPVESVSDVLKTEEIHGKISTVTSTTQNKNQQQQQQHSSPNDSASQDESSEESKRVHREQETMPRKRRRTRKTSERDPQNQDASTKRRRTMTHKKNAPVASDSDDTSDSVALRLAVPGRNQPQAQQHQQLQPQMQEQGTSSGLRPCPFNFLVQLDPQLNSDQCIAILLKQIQELRKTYNDIKSDLAAIDRRRKKLRRRDREKKQIQHQQQPTQLLKVGIIS